MGIFNYIIPGKRFIKISLLTLFQTKQFPYLLSITSVIKIHKKNKIFVHSSYVIHNLLLGKLQQYLRRELATNKGRPYVSRNSFDWNNTGAKLCNARLIAFIVTLQLLYREGLILVKPPTLQIWLTAISGFSQD